MQCRMDCLFFYEKRKHISTQNNKDKLAVKLNASVVNDNYQKLCIDNLIAKHYFKPKHSMKQSIYDYSKKLETNSILHVKHMR